MHKEGVQNRNRHRGRGESLKSGALGSQVARQADDGEYGADETQRTGQFRDDQPVDTRQVQGHQHQHPKGRGITAGDQPIEREPMAFGHRARKLEVNEGVVFDVPIAVNKPHSREDTESDRPEQ